MIKVGNSASIVLAMAVCSAVLGLIGIFIFDEISSASIKYLIYGASFHIAARIVGQQAYRFGDMGQVYPIVRGSTPIFVALLALYISGEAVSTGGTFALIGIALGVAIVALKGGAIRSGFSTGAVIYSLLAAVLSTSYIVIDGVGVRASQSPLAYVAWISLIDGLGSAAVLYFSAKTNYRSIPLSTWKLGFSAGILQVISWGLVVVAMNYAPMSLVAATRETSLVFGFGISLLILKERYSHWRALGSSTIALSLILFQSFRG